MPDIRKETETRYHIRFYNPYNSTIEVSKDVMMACQRAKEFFEKETSFKSVYVVEVKEKLIKSFE